ncbi:exonuclease [Gordonia phage Jumbo]|uniref:Exonuclease n=1 Tax=Gordonia phage Jumbo TaxID=1887650 RepID=A0A1B3B0T8_9CAUD|nr:DNA polymerase exonuclease subunit [Gordonia phage Jumbo]AOE44612.1 exonuclease [Gordonia phage Jumbo]
MRQKKMAQPKVVILDIETTGLDPQQNIMIELGIQLYTARLELIDERSWIMSDSNTVNHVNLLSHKELGNDYVLNMHTENGLIQDIQSKYDSHIRMDQAMVETEAIDWLKEYSLGKNRVQLPLCGSSIHFDRQFLSLQMPNLNAAFHYRNIDISSIKEMARIYKPALLENAAPANKTHRVLDDCTASRNELEYYVESLFLT